LNGEPLTEPAARNVTYLIDKEIIEPTESGYCFQVLMVERFVREMVSPSATDSMPLS
jgi:hypothetical protein